MFFICQKCGVASSPKVALMARDISDRYFPDLRSRVRSSKWTGTVWHTDDTKVPKEGFSLSIIVLLNRASTVEDKVLEVLQGSAMPSTRHMYADEPG
ncbi:hypothetical protein J6590_042126 [Homalodisca vitripennis]|nr:hypothetical protein J6590_042126 [Homalodisca vitripennis]